MIYLRLTTLLSVSDVALAVRFYVDVLAHKFGHAGFAEVERYGVAIMLALPNAHTF